MFDISTHERGRMTAAHMAKFFKGFAADTEGWEGDSRDLFIGDADELDEEYRLIGTCGELAQHYRELAEAQAQ